MALLLSSNVAEFLSGPRPCWLNVPRAVIARAVVVILLLPSTWLLLLLLLFVRNELDRFHLLERVELIKKLIMFKKLKVESNNNVFN